MNNSNNLLKQRIDYLEAEIKRVRKLYEKTLKYQDIDPEVSLFQARKSAEAICKSIYIKEGLHKEKGKPVSKLMLDELVQSLGRKNILPEHIRINLTTIQAFGNFGSHYQGEEENGVITAEYIKPCLLGLGTVFSWYVQWYYKNNDAGILAESDIEASKVCYGDQRAPVHNNISNIKAKVLTVIGNHAPPYRIFKDNVVAGIYFDIIKEIARRLKVEVNFINKPYKTALLMMKSGEADMMVGPNKTEQRQKFMIYSNATLPSERKGFFVHIKGKPILSYEDLYERLLIVSRGKVYSDQIDSDPKLKKITITDYTQGFQLLSENPDYVMVMPEKEGEFLIDEQEYDVLASPFYMEGRLSYLSLSKKSKHSSLFVEIDGELGALKKEGFYEEIMHYY